MRCTIDSTCVCTSVTWSSVASGDTTYTSSYFRLITSPSGLRPFDSALRALAQGKESINIGRVSVRGRRGARVKRVHHFRDAFRGKHLGGIRRPRNERFEIGLFAALEPCEHVVGQIAPAISAPDSQPKPGEFRGPQPLDNRLETVVPARRSAGACT